MKGIDNYILHSMKLTDSTGYTVKTSLESLLPHIHHKTHDSLAHLDIVDLSNDHTLSLRSLKPQKASNPKSMLSRIFQTESRSKGDLPTQSTYSRKLRPQYSLNHHLRNLSQSSTVIKKLATHFKAQHREQFYLDESHQMVPKTLFDVMQSTFLRCPDTDDVGPHILQQVEVCHKKLLHKSVQSSPSKEKMDMSFVPPPSPTPSYEQVYRNSVRKRLSVVKSKDQQEVFDRLKSNYQTPDPIDVKKLEQIQDFFYDFFNNVTKYLKHTNHNITYLNGCTTLIYQSFFTNGHLIPSNSLDLYHLYLKCDSIDQSMDLHNQVQAIEKSPFYRKLQYFNNSLLQSIKHRLLEKLDQHITLKTTLHAQILQKNKKPRPEQQICQPLSLSAPMPPILGSPLNRLRQLDRFKSEMMDINISKTHCLRMQQ